jgi:hypothetical protein
MGASQRIINWNPFASLYSWRRRLVRCLAVAALVIAATGSIGLRAQKDMPPELPAPAPPAVPRPQYVPPGYSLLGEYRGNDDGFGTGEAEIKIAYLNPEVYKKRIFGPLLVIVSPMTSNPFWYAESGTPAMTPELLTLRIGGEVTVECRYYNGKWRPTPDGERTLPNGTRGTWDTSNLNCLVFPFDGFMIGIVGSKLGGVGRAELIKITESLKRNGR